jgi:hypothetical protein
MLGWQQLSQGIQDKAWPVWLTYASQQQDTDFNPMLPAAEAQVGAAPAAADAAAAAVPAESNSRWGAQECLKLAAVVIVMLLAQAPREYMVVLYLPLSLLLGIRSLFTWCGAQSLSNGA